MITGVLAELITPLLSCRRRTGRSHLIIVRTVTTHEQGINAGVVGGTSCPQRYGMTKPISYSRYKSNRQYLIHTGAATFAGG